MSVVIALGSNLGDRQENLNLAIEKLKAICTIEEASSVYESEPVDYLQQESFYNLALQILPKTDSPLDFLKQTQSIELAMGRKKEIPKGPRNIDIDLIFWHDLELRTSILTIPHPAWKERAFVVYPLQELTLGQKMLSLENIDLNFNHSIKKVSTYEF